MNKCLEAIDILKERKWVDIEQYKSLCELIKIALIDGEIEHTIRIGLENDNYKLMREKQDNEKKLKALEIIINKRVDMILLVHACRIGYGYDFFNYRCEVGYELTKEEYDLLKEVLL